MATQPSRWRRADEVRHKYTQKTQQEPSDMAIKRRFRSHRRIAKQQARPSQTESALLQMSSRCAC